MELSIKRLTSKKSTRFFYLIFNNPSKQKYVTYVYWVHYNISYYSNDAAISVIFADKSFKVLASSLKTNPRFFFNFTISFSRSQILSSLFPTSHCDWMVVTSMSGHFVCNSLARFSILKELNVVDE